MDEARAERARPAVEQYGVEPVPRNLRTGTFHDLFAIIFTWCLSPVFVVIGALAVTDGGLSVWWAAGACALGQFLSSLVLGVVARVGVNYGLPGQVALRATFGEWGARLLTSPYRLVAVVYWFAVQALAGALAIRALVRALTGFDPGFIPVALVLAALAALLAIVGFDTVRYLTRVVLPVMLVFTGIMVGLFVAADEPGYAVSRVLGTSAVTWTGFAIFLTALAAGGFTFVTNVADLSRYSRSRLEAQLAFLLGSTSGTFLATWVGAYAAVASGSTNPFLAAVDLTGSKAILAVLLAAIVVQTMSVNNMNLYTGGLSLVNMAPRLGRVVATAAVAVAAIAVSAFPAFIEEAQTWITHLGSAGSPLAGVIAADYAILQRERIDVPALFDRSGRYRYLRGLNPAAVVAVGIGIGVYYAVPDDWLKFIWGVGAGAAAHLALATLQAALLPRTRVDDEPAAGLVSAS